MLQKVDPQELKWQNELRHAIKSPRELKDYFQLDVHEVHSHYPVFIPLPLAKEMKDKGPGSPLWKQFVPSSKELNRQEGHSDPIGDSLKSPARQVVHRYENRVLLFPTSVCPIQCRYCFRKNQLHEPEEQRLYKGNFEKAFAYIEEHAEIDEVILSGGDPLILSNASLEKLLYRISNIKHVRHFRIHTRTPIVMPSRITDAFIDLLQTYQKRFSWFHLVLHANHKDEFLPATKRAISLLKNSGIEMLSQSVLLKGINDDEKSLVNLINSFLELGVRPYYLHHPDQVRGGMHFFLDQEMGKKIYQKVKKHFSGWALPRYVSDHPSANGKTPIL